MAKKQKRAATTVESTPEPPQAAAARHAEEAAKGLRCPKCHGTDLRLGWIKGELDGSKTRSRVCRNCGKRVLTRETILGENIAG